MARKLYFFPRKFDGEQALEMGILTELFTADEFEQSLDAMARSLANAAPLALAGMKANFVAAEKMDLGGYIALETYRHAQLFHSKDRLEGFQAFLEKRPPRFKGE